MWRVTLCFVLLTINLAASLNNEGRKVHVLVAKKYQEGVALTKLYRNTDELLPSWQQIHGSNNRAGDMSYFTAYNNSHDGFTKRITLCNYFDTSLITDADDCSSLDGSSTAVFSFFAADVQKNATRKITFEVCFDHFRNISYSVVSTGAAYCRGHHTVLTSGHFFAFVGWMFCKTPDPPSEGTIRTRIFEDDVRLVSVTFDCIVGYKIRGLETNTCYFYGHWRTVGDGEPTCEAISCGTPIIKHGNPKSTKFTFPERTSFHCDPGYTLSPPNATIDCLATGEWYGTFGECKPTSCDTPPPVEHGRMIGSVYTYRQKLKSVCDEGYKNLVRNPVIECQRHGRWLGSTAKCRPIVCRDPGVPINGRRIGDDFSYGSTVRFDCNEGYTLLGHASITCGKEVWMGFKPTCEASSYW